MTSAPLMPPMQLAAGEVAVEPHAGARATDVAATSAPRGKPRAKWANPTGTPRKHTMRDRRADLYETPPVAVTALLETEPVPLTVWEPACGPGAIVRELRASGRAVYATDLIGYGCPDSHSAIDFLMERQAPSGIPSIVTNPPFSLVDRFAEKAIDLAPQVYLLLRLAYLEGKDGKRSHPGLRTRFIDKSFPYRRFQSTRAAVA